MPKYLKAVAEHSAATKGDPQTSSHGHTVFPLERIFGEVEILSDVCFADDAPIYRHLGKSWPAITLNGEIHLEKNLLPSSNFLPFSVQVSLQLRSSYH